ncbi:MAG: ribosome silencing factor [Chitinophagales bacterium]
MKEKAVKEMALKDIVVDAVLDKKAHEVLVLDLRDLDESICDYFVVCHGESTTQVSGIADSVYKSVKEQKGLTPRGADGKENANWIVLDYFDIVVHVFHREAREYYQLEELWSDAIITEHE